MKRSFVLSFVLIFLSAVCCFANPPDTLDIHLFYGEGCPHCKKEELHLQLLEKRFSNLKVHRYEVYYNDSNMELFRRIAKSLEADVSGVPFLVVGNEYVVGFDETTTPGIITAKIEKCLAGPCPDSFQITLEGREKTDLALNASATPAESSSAQKEKIIRIPLLGEIDVYSFSLPMLTIVMGFLDGFNPCAMWTLLFLISLLLGMKDKRKMWILGTAFIAGSALVYFLFMAAWLNLILLLGLVLWIRITIGILALGSGMYSVRDFWVNKEGTCTLSGNVRRQQIYEKIKAIINQHSFVLSLCGIILLAFMVNLIEIVCSAGFPAIYTQVLSLNELPLWKYYAYIVLYIVFFMIDDFFVFVTAMITFEITGMTTKYVRYARLIGGLTMLMIGILLIFRPQWLMFG
ncbi:MAG: hypothetical protein GXY42_08755 [Desulfovibrionales bacterium]|nr:hypothetical protein [Desulfovibrionales bacterium]